MRGIEWAENRVEISESTFIFIDYKVSSRGENTSIK